MARDPAKRDSADCCKQLLIKGLPKLLGGEPIEFDDVWQVYGAQNDQCRGYFRYDIGKIELAVRQVQSWLEPLGVILPTLKVTKTSLRIPVRGFQERLNSKSASIRRKLAQALVAQQADSLLPQEGCVFLGYGSTVYFLAREILADERFKGVWFYTSNVEIALYVYLCVPPHFRHNNRFFLPGCEIDLASGKARRAKQINFSTAVVSFSWMKKTGDLYTKDERDVELPQEALASAGKVIILGDDTKIKDVAGVKIDLQPRQDQRIYFVTNKLPDEFNAPAGTTHIQLDI